MSYHSNGPAHLDKTADDFYVLPGAFSAACERHAERFDGADLAELLNDNAHLLLQAVKSGDAAAVGRLICAAYVSHIEDLAAISVN